MNSIQRNPPCVNGLIHNIYGLKKLWIVLSEEHSFNFLRTNKLNQDPLENEFSCVRRACGNNDTPNAQQFGTALKYSCIKKNMLSITNTNCEDDNHVPIACNESDQNDLLENDPLEGCDEFVLRPLDPLEENVPVPDVLERNALLYVTGYSISKLTHKKCIKKLNQSQADDAHDYTFCLLKKNLNSKHFIVPSKNALKIGLDVLNAFKQKFQILLNDNRKGIKLRLKEYIEYDQYESVMCYNCFNKVINRLFNTFIKAEVRKIQQKNLNNKNTKRMKKNTKARRLGIPSNVQTSRKNMKSRTTKSTCSTSTTRNDSNVHSQPFETEYVNCPDDGFEHNTEYVNEENPLDVDGENNSQSGEDQENQKMNECIKALEELLKHLPEQRKIEVEKRYQFKRIFKINFSIFFANALFFRDCFRLTIAEINDTFAEFKPELQCIFDKYKTFSSYQLAKIHTLASFEQVCRIFTDDQLYAMVLYLDSQLVLPEDTGLVMHLKINVFHSPSLNSDFLFHFSVHRRY